MTTTHLWKAFAILGVVILAIVAWIGWTTAKDDQMLLEMQFRDLITERLKDHNRTISRFVSSREEIFDTSLTELLNGQNMREATYKSSLVTQYFWIDWNSNLIFPNPNAIDTSSRERAFIERSQDLLASQALLRSTPREKVVSSSKSVKHEGISIGEWQSYYWNNGLQLIYFRKVKNSILALEVNRSRFIADLIAELPETSDFFDIEKSAVQLIDSQNAVIHQWGELLTQEEGTWIQKAEIAAAPPLGAWKLRFLVSKNAQPSALGASSTFFALAGTIALGLTMAVLGSYLYREQTKAARAAEERVNFVNQVSHELKTPLTSIRMNAELLAESAEAITEKQGKRLDTIVLESQRLSRLINNVLNFRSHERGKLRLNKSAARVSDLLSECLAQLEPTLTRSGIRTHQIGGNTVEVLVDRDVFYQIIANLLSNTEKYAKNSGECRIEHRYEQGVTTITVSDSGPGIDVAEQELVFEPFYRIKDNLTEGVSGTGIGLSLSRQLARLHGGDLRLLSSSTGATFELTLQTPPVEKTAGKSK